MTPIAGSNYSTIYLTSEPGTHIISICANDTAGLLGCSSSVNTTASGIKYHEDSYEINLDNGDVLHSDALILATPPFVTADLIGSYMPQLASILQEIPYVSTATVSLAYKLDDLPRELDGYGYVIPRREGRKALACTWTSTKFPHRAPDGHALVRVFIGRAGQEDDIPWNEEALLEIARQ